MLTPRFKLSQDENRVYITVHAPYTNISETEIDVDGENFLFVSSPYFLRLYLPGKIVENDLSKGAYICDSGDFNLIFAKENPGEYFENLDMITSLLTPRDIPNMDHNLIEVLEEHNVTDNNSVKEVLKNEYDVKEPFKESLNEELIMEDAEYEELEDLVSCNYPYGFANKTSVTFGDVAKEFPQIFELKQPDEVPIPERHVLRIKYENRKFSSDHYIADFFDEELLYPYLNFIVFWRQSDFESEIEFTDDEIEILKDLPNRQYLLNGTEYKQIMLGLVDILYAFCYDKRTTQNESTVESSWTINKLSSTLSWFCVFNETKEVLIACYRRALIFPIYRNFLLCKNVKTDLLHLLKLGKKFVIKCLLDIYTLFNTSNDARYILNQLYIKDYIIFLQKCRDEELEQLCNNIANIEIIKKDVELNLDKLEETSISDLSEHPDVVQNELACEMASLSLVPGLRKLQPPAVIVNYDVSDSNSDSSGSSSDSSSDSSDSLDSDDDPF